MAPTRAAQTVEKAKAKAIAVAEPTRIIDSTDRQLIEAMAVLRDQLARYQDCIEHDESRMHKAATYLRVLETRAARRGIPAVDE